MLTCTSLERNTPLQSHTCSKRDMPPPLPPESGRRNLATTPTTKVTQKMASPTNPPKQSVKVIGEPPSSTHYGPRRTVGDDEEHDCGVKELVQRNFYVDDSLVSKRTAEEVVTLIRNTQDTLASANLRLHKVVSN